ncbi:MAG: hypothetical protein M3N33_00410 [Actinomycetota bacterium]|nr:hypothetical protein [Actinomycetota bacterium]
MRRMVSVLSAAALVAATTVATAVPAFAQTTGAEEFLPDISVRSGQPGDPVWGYLTISDGCVDFFGAIDVPGHASDTSDDFQGPVCLF